MREILLDTLCGETRTAVYEDGVLCEYTQEICGRESLVGNLYVGRVCNLLPGMNAAFVDIGQEKNAFLQAGDVARELQGDRALTERLGKSGIREIARPGSEILVQVVKEPGGTKGPRVTASPTLPGKYAVLLPTLRYIGVSRKITEEEVRAQLREAAEGLMAEKGMGMILRTAAGEASFEEIREEYLLLAEKWAEIARKAACLKAPALLRAGGNPAERAVRDLMDENAVIFTDDPGIYQALLQAGAPRERTQLRQGEIPLFDARGVDGDYEKAAARRVWLKSGGNIIVDRTEAMTVIDVNTGKYVGKRQPEETNLRTNCEAAVEIARQLRLRDVGGMVIVDFIDLEKEISREKLEACLKEALARDRQPVTIVGMTGLGLMEMTRKRTRRGMDAGHACPLCGGTGFVEDAGVTARKILRQIRRRQMINPDQAYLVRAAAPVTGALVGIGAPKGAKIHAEIAPEMGSAWEIETLGLSETPGDWKWVREY
ncbi:MAG: Rne/Rng family ribonuclease [Eubacteriales bacterium]|nr:Rne/Rng family ribonuclease [Eubacteriales bacterium]